MTKQQREGQPQLSENNEWLRRLDRISVAVEAWRKRAESPLSLESGSSLAADSIAELSVGNPIWYSMCISSEHLDFSIEAMRATSTMYPTAYMTVARTAFVAAVNAVWVLAPPTRQERRERALRLRADELRVQASSFRDIKIPQGEPEEARTGMLRQLRKQQDSLQEVATTLGIKENVTKMRFHQTGAIDWVAQYMYGRDDGFLIGATQVIWRSGSAAAHAQYHFGVMRLNRNEVVREESGDAILRLRGDLDNDIGPAIAAATMILSEAFRLYDLRRVNHIRP